MATKTPTVTPTMALTIFLSSYTRLPTRRLRHKRLLKRLITRQEWLLLHFYRHIDNYCHTDSDTNGYRDGDITPTVALTTLLSSYFTTRQPSSKETIGLKG